VNNIKGLFSGLAGVFFYAVENIIIRSNLSGLAPERVTAYFYIGTVAVTLFLAPFAFCFKEWFGVDFTPVSLKIFGIMVLCILVEIIADYMYFRAYCDGMTVATVTTIMSFLPIVAVVVEAVVAWKMIPVRVLAGCLLVPVAIYLVNSK